MSIEPILRRHLDRIDDLCVFPAVAGRVMRVAREADSTVTDMKGVVEQDPVLAGRIVELANSALFARGVKVDSLRRAIQRLGFRRTRDAAVALALTSLGREATPCATALWRHAMQSAEAARVLSEHLPRDVGSRLFTAALVHDLGRQLMAVLDEPALVAILDAERDGHPAVLELERDVFGVDHTTLGAACLRRWSFDDALVDAIASHHLPAGQVVGCADPRLVAALQLADAFARAVAHARRVVGVVTTVASEPAVRVLGLRSEPLEEVAAVLVATSRASRRRAA